MKTNFKIRNKKCCIGQIYEREKAHCIVSLKTSFHKKDIKKTVNINLYT